MSSTPPRTHAKPPETGVPYASYAQIVRMLLPLTGKISFYDENGHALWISDGLEEPELRIHVEILLSRCSQEAPGETPVDCSASEQGQPTYVFPVRNLRGTLVGAMAVVFRDVPANTTYRRVETVERLLAPLLEILSYGWRTHVDVDVPVLHREAEVPPSYDPADAFASAPEPALVRRTLALATHRLQCAFGAFVVAGKPFTLTHRASPDESDVTMNAAVDAVRAPMLKLMQVRSEALIVNGASGRDRSAPYKFLVLPLRPTSNRLDALLMLFRSKHAPDFTSSDVDALAQVAARLTPPPVLTETAPGHAIEAPSAPVEAVEPKSVQATEPTTPIFATSRPMPARPVPLVITPDAALPMDARIRAALRADGFDLYAQRISPLRDERRPARFEVLVRMQDANHLRAPASFFEAAEASALLPDLDRWVIRRLLGTLKAHADHVRSGRSEFCINIAAQSLVSDGFREFLVAEVCRSSIPAGLLVFEIAECDALEHQHALALLGTHLRDVGCRLALDNCRAGVTTFGPLHKWPVSCVKIDGSLIGKLHSHPRSESVVRAVTQLASSMGIETVAERVESGEICDKLIDIGIDYAQGFHFGQPQPLANVFQ